jgi:hypothetical protein
MQVLSLAFHFFLVLNAWLYKTKTMSFVLQAEKAAFDEAEKKRLEEVCKHLFSITLALLLYIQY